MKDETTIYGIRCLGIYKYKDTPAKIYNPLYFRSRDAAEKEKDQYEEHCEIVYDMIVTDCEVFEATLLDR